MTCQVKAFLSRLSGNLNLQAQIGRAEVPTTAQNFGKQDRQKNRFARDWKSSGRTLVPANRSAVWACAGLSRALCEICQT